MTTWNVINTFKKDPGEFTIKLSDTVIICKSNIGSVSFWNIYDGVCLKHLTKYYPHNFNIPLVLSGKLLILVNNNDQIHILNTLTYEYVNIIKSIKSKYKIKEIKILSDNIILVTYSNSITQTILLRVK